MRVPVDIFDTLADEATVCVYCDTLASLPYCVGCREYKGLMSISEWESYTGEVWEA